MKPLERKVMYFVSLINTLDTNKTIENNYTQTRTGADTGVCKWVGSGYRGVQVDGSVCRGVATGV